MKGQIEATELKPRYFVVAVYDRSSRLPIDNVRLKFTPPEDQPALRPSHESLMYYAAMKAYNCNQARAEENCTGFAVMPTTKEGVRMGEPSYYGVEKFGRQAQPFEIVQVTMKGEISTL